MREFFRGWRRKVGCVALVMACIVVGMWIRSSVFYDQCAWADTNRKNVVYSLNGEFGWWHWEGSRRKPISFGSFPLAREDEAKWRMILEMSRLQNDARGWTCLYWHLAIPLTLLSAYLLLWKPRKRTGADNGEFFRGWRRKAGCIALVMALLFTGSWVRSLTCMERAYLTHRDGTYGIGHHCGFIWCSYNYEDDADFRIHWWSSDFDPGTGANHVMPIWYAGDGDRCIRHWVFAVPLTLLSAYLLLWKPRQRTEPDHA